LPVEKTRIRTKGSRHSFIEGIHGSPIVTPTHYVVVDANEQFGRGPALIPSSRRYQTAGESGLQETRADALNEVQRLHRRTQMQGWMLAVVFLATVTVIVGQWRPG
jgi:hypothetical protein